MEDRNLDELRSIFNNRLKDASNNSFFGVVTGVDPEERTCTVQYEGVNYYDVRLYASIDAELKGMCTIPAEGSNVVVSKLGGSEQLYVSMFSSVDEVKFTCGEELTATMNEEGLVIHTAENVVTTINESGVVIQTDENVTSTFDASGLAVKTADNVTATFDSKGITIEADEAVFKATSAGFKMDNAGKGLKKTLEDLCDAISAITTVDGKALAPNNIAEFKVLKTSLSQFLE